MLHTGTRNGWENQKETLQCVHFARYHHLIKNSLQNVAGAKRPHIVLQSVRKPIGVSTRRHAKIKVLSIQHFWTTIPQSKRTGITPRYIHCTPYCPTFDLPKDFGGKMKYSRHWRDRPGFSYQKTRIRKVLIDEEDSSSGDNGNHSLWRAQFDSN